MDSFLKMFWPIRTGITFFDVWSIAHVTFWIFIGSCIWNVKAVPRPAWMAICLALAYGWEVFERYAEKKWPNLWLSPESWANSWVSDPLMCVLGLLFMWYALDHWRF